MKRMFTKALNLFSVLLLLVSIGFSFFAVAQPNSASAAWDGTVATSFSSGSGTEVSPYVIATETQLGYFFKQIQSGVTYEGMYIKLSKDLNMTGSTWSTGATKFQGNFHGMGYTITADCPFMAIIGEYGTVQGLNYVLAVDYDSDVFCSTNYGTLFGCIVMGNAESDTTQESWTHSIGLLCDTNYGTIRGCGGVGSVYARGDDSDAYAGLIAENYGQVDRCYSAVSASASAPGKYNYDYDHPLVGRNDPSGTGATVTNSIYDSNIYTATTTIGFGLTTAELQSSTALAYLGSALPTNCRWVIDGDMGGYPHLAHASAYYSYVTGHQGESRILYNAKSTYVTLTKSASVGTIYYTLDEHETDPSKFMTYSSGSSIFISGDKVLSTAVYYNGSFGAVTRQEFFSLPGSGTASSPYQISTPKQLTALGMFPDAHFILTEDITFTDEDYALTGAAPGQWKPISTFSGTLDGKGHAIYGLKSKLGGLVDSNNGTITSLRMIDHRLHGPGASGAIANWNSGTVTRCYTKSAFTLTDLPNVLDPEIGQEVGGVVGFNNGGTVSYCRNDGIVAVTDTTREAHLWMGGIVGEGKAESCINTGLLVVSNDATINYPYIGGITGGGNVDNCLARGNVYLDIKCNYEVFIAGLSGHHSSGFAHTSIASSYSVTDVSDSHGALRKSPFVGYYQGSASSCYYDGQVQLPEDGPDLDFDTKWMVSNEGIVPQGVMDENGHAYRLSTTQIYPTCRANGDQWVVCDICGQTDVITVKAIGHRYTNYLPDGNATCLEDGTKTAKCDRCEYTNTRADAASALGHSFEGHVADGNATCTEDGTKTGKCIRCDVTETIANTGAALGHSFTQYVSNGDALCETDGTETAKCDRCDVTDTRTEAGTALGHSFTEYISNADATCLEDGTKTAKCDRCEVTDTLTDEGTALGHSFTSYVSDGNAGCYTDGTETARCDRCEVTDSRTEEGTAGHLFTNYVSNGNATCLYPGTMTAKCDRCEVKDTQVEVGSQKGHSFTNYVSNGDADCLTDGTKTAKCDRCTVTDTQSDEGSALGHSFTNYISDGNVTCTEDGTQTAKCDRCEVTDTIPLKALGHEMSDWYTVTEASCTESGLEQADCGNCDYSETRIIPILPHRYEGVVTEPTCTEQGYTTYTCSCGESYVSDRMPVLGHSFTEYVSDGNATCTADGTQTAKCDRCQVTDTVTMKALGHSFTNYTSIGNATCTADGLKIATCDRCDAMDYAVDAGSMLGHSFTEYVSNGDATCLGNGTETAKCDRCDVTDTREDVDSALGHDLGAWYTVTGATCTEDGLERTDCSRCDYSEERSIVASGHSHEAVVTEPTCTEQGYTTHTCHCGDSYVDGYTEMLGHSFTKYVSNEDANCTEDGTETAKCDRCEETDIRIDENSALGHSFSAWIRDEDAGIETSTCDRCGETEEREITEYSGVCGDNLTWTLDMTTGELRISGTGDMYDYDGISNPAPWQKYASSVQTLTLEEGITRIGDQSFTVYFTLSEITLPESLTSIGHYAFAHSDELIRINIPKNADTINPTAFSNCDNLVELLVDSLNPYYSEKDSVLFNKDQTVLICYPDNHGEEYIIPETVTTIGSNAFWHSNNLRRITIPDHVTAIGTQAFDMSFIVSVVLPDSLSSIESNAFSATHLTSITIPDSVISIDDNAFSVCRFLTEVNLPDSLTRIGSYAFYACESLTSITIPEGVTEIDENTFWKCKSLESITLPQSVTSIDKNAFEDCSALTDVYYGGTEEMKGLLVIDGMNDPLVNATWHCRVCEHSFGDWETVVEATCLDAGEEARYCSDCVAREIREIPAAGHKFESAVTEPTCLDMGYTTHTCHCGNSYQSSFTGALGHSFTQYVSNGDATCTEDGTETAKCDRCDVTDTRTAENSALGHDMGQWYTVTEAGCTEEGLEQSDCSRCEHFETQAIAAVGHSHESVVTEPTCLEQGYTTYTCHCGDSYVDSYTEALGHEYEHFTVEPTCTEQGYTTHDCVRCEDMGVSDYTEALGHSFNQYVSNGDATCTGDGTETAKCDRCDVTDSRIEMGSALGHDMGQWYTVTASCTADGLERTDCSRCEYYETRTIPAGGHNVENGVCGNCGTTFIQILQQPFDVTAAAGQDAAVYVDAIGTDLTYAWYYKNAGGTKFSLTNAFTSNTYSVSMTAARSGRQVYCVITDKYGYSVQTDTVTLTMLTGGIEILQQPFDVIAATGQDASVYVDAIGEDLTYAWYYRNAGSSKFTLTTAFTGNTYSVSMTAARSGRQVYCVITDKYGNSVQTDTVTLTMLAGGIEILQQPFDVTAAAGEQASVYVDAIGEDLTYAWYYKNAGSSKFTLTTAFTGNTYSVSMTAARSGRQVYCVITDKYGNSVQTDTVTLQILFVPQLEILTQPESLTVPAGSSAKVTVKAAGEGLSYTWYYRNADSNKFSKTSSFTGPSYSLTMNAARSGRHVYCVIKDISGNSVTTNTVTLNMASELELLWHPEDVVAATGETAAVTVDAVGEDLTYSWYYRNAGAKTFTETASFTGNTYSLKMTAARSGRQVYCVIQDRNGNTVATDIVTLIAE